MSVALASLLGLALSGVEVQDPRHSLAGYDSCGLVLRGHDGVSPSGLFVDPGEAGGCGGLGAPTLQLRVEPHQLFYLGATGLPAIRSSEFVRGC